MDPLPHPYSLLDDLSGWSWQQRSGSRPDSPWFLVHAKTGTVFESADAPGTRYLHNPRPGGIQSFAIHSDSISTNWGAVPSMHELEGQLVKGVRRSPSMQHAYTQALRHMLLLGATGTVWYDRTHKRWVGDMDDKVYEQLIHDTELLSEILKPIQFLTVPHPDTATNWSWTHDLTFTFPSTAHERLELLRSLTPD